MKANSLDEQYAESLNFFGIPRDKDPFPLDPPKEVDYWADNKKVLEEIAQIQIDSEMFSSSSIYIFYGPIGGGKTFAVKYLANEKTQRLFYESLKKPLIEHFYTTVSAIQPKRAGDLTWALQKEIVKQIFNEIFGDKELALELKKAKKVGTGKIKAAITDLQKSLVIPLVGEINETVAETSEGYKFFTQSRSRLGKLSDINEMVESISVLVSILSKKYGRVVISIDELENLSHATGTEQFLCSDFLRKMHDNIDDNLTLFLVFTFDSYQGVTDLLQKALQSRVKQSIEFPFVNKKDDVKEYITECILQRSKIQPYELIDEEVIDDISEKLIKQNPRDLSFRTINKQMKRIFASACKLLGPTGKPKIDMTLYKEMIGTITAKEVVEQVKEKLNK